MKARVLKTSLADAQLLTIVAWWRQNRPAAPYPFDDEVEEAFEPLAHEPEAGKPAPLQKPRR